MATIVNARDVILQSASPRFLGVQVGSNIQVPISNVPGLTTALDGTKEVSLAGTSQVYQIPKTGSVSPSSITLSATLKNLTGTPSLSLTNGTMSVTPALTGGVFTFTPAQMTSDSVTFRLSLTAGSTTYTDDWTVVKVREGADALSGFLTNESCTVAADKLGNVTSYTGVSGNFKVFQGSVDVTTACTFSVPSGGNPNGLTYSLTASGSGAGTYGVTGGFAAGVDQVTLTIRATFGSTTIDKVFSISKSKAGAGTSSISIQGDNLDANEAGYYANPRGVVLSSGYNTTAAGRGHTMFVFNPANDSIVTAPTLYDTYDPVTLPSLVAAINNVAVGHILCLWSYDATSKNSALNAALADFGSGDTQTWTSSRYTHVFIGMKGLLPGQAYEKIGPYVSSSNTGVYRLDAYYGPSGIVVNGAKGSNGSSGVNGARGSQTFYVAISGTSFNDSVATSTASVNGGPIYGDVVTQYDNANKFSLSKYWGGSNWITINAVVDGNLLVQGSVGAQKLIVNNGSGNNLWWDANYQDTSQWFLTTVAYTLPTQVVVSDGIAGGRVFRSTTGGNGSAISFVNRVPVTVGKQYRISVKVRRNSTANGNVYIRYDPNTAQTGSYDNSNMGLGLEGLIPPSVGAWVEYSAVFTAALPYVGLNIFLNNVTGAVGYYEAQDIRIEELMDSALVVLGGIGADRIDSRGLSIKDGSGNIILAAGNALPLTYTDAGAVNSNIVISSGAISGIGSGSGTVVANSNIAVSSGTITGIGTGNGATVDNGYIGINSSGQFYGGGAGTGTTVSNNQISVSLASNAYTINGIGSSGTINIGGLGYTGDLNATSGAPSGTYVAGDLAQNVLRPSNPITSGNVGTYIASAAIGSAYIGVLTAANLTVTAVSNTVNGGVSSGGRVQITTNRVEVYDSSNQLRVRIGEL